MGAWIMQYKHYERLLPARYHDGTLIEQGKFLQTQNEVAERMETANGFPGGKKRSSNDSAVVDLDGRHPN